MSFIFACSHNTWYQTVKRLPLSIASLIVIPSPVITAFLAYLITHEPLYYYHYVGIVGEILGLYALILIQQKQKKGSK
jgi:drug/metabolite transporter (DMT)-like permease